MDSRPRNDQGQFAPETQGGLDANNTSAAYNPQIIENRKATLGEKLRRAIGLRGGVEESVPERVLSRFNHGGHGEHDNSCAKLRLRELAEKPFLKQDEKLMKDGPAKRAVVSSGIAGGIGAGAGALYGSALHSLLTDNRIKSKVGAAFPKLLKHAKASSMGKYALLGAAAGSVPAILQYPVDYAAKRSRREGLKKYPKSVGEIGVPGYTESYSENKAWPTLSAYFRKKEMSTKFFGKLEDEDTSLKKVGRVARTAAIGGLAGRVAAWHPVHGGKMNRATMIGAGLGALSQGAFEHIASAKTGLHGHPVDVTDESRKSTRDLGGVLPALGVTVAGYGALRRNQKDAAEDFLNQELIRMGRPAREKYAAKEQTKARRAMGLEGETFIPKMPKFSMPFSQKSKSSRNVDEIGGGIEQKLERLARSAKGTPEGDVALKKLNAIKEKNGKTFMGKLKKTISKAASKFKPAGSPQKVIGRLLSAKLRLRELARQTAYDPYAAQAQPAERGQAGKDFRNAAIGIGALGAGGGVAYAGWNGAQAAKSAQTLTDDALKTSGEARKAARTARVTAARLNRVGKTIKTQLTTFPTFKKVASKFFEEDLQSLRELATISDRLIEFVAVDPGHVVPGLWSKISGKAKFDAAKNAASLAKDYRAWPKSAFGGKSREYAREQIARGRKLSNQGRIQRAASIAGAGGLAAAGAATLVPSKKEFAEKERSGLQKAGIAAGLGAAAVGASFMPAATKLWRIQAREAAKKAQSAISKSKGMKNIIKSPLDDPNRGGKIVADYLDASQLAMNRGLHGKVIGKVLQHAKANPGGRVSKTIGGDFGVSHYARFRAGPKQALGHWDWELGESNALKGKGRGPDWLTKRQNNIARGRESAHAEINNRLYNHGENESEAIRHVATNSQSKDTREYFDLLAAHKAGAAKMYAKKALIAPGLIVAGGVTAAASSRKKDS